VLDDLLVLASMSQSHDRPAPALLAALRRSAAIPLFCALALRPGPFVKQVTRARNRRDAPIRHSVEHVTRVRRARALLGSWIGQHEEFSLQGGRRGGGGGDAPEDVASPAPAAEAPSEAGGLVGGGIGIGARGREPRRIRVQEASGHIWLLFGSREHQ